MNAGAGRWVAGGLALVVIGGAGVLLHRQLFRSRGQELLAEGRMMLIHCPACGHAERLQVPFDQQFPMACPGCGERKAVWGQRCGSCGRVFVRPRAARYRCPHCPAEYYTEEGGEDMSGTPDGD